MIKADFDSLMNMFAQVGSFLNLLKILEKGMPASTPFKQSITDSMSTFLVVFGVSIRYMKKEGRTRMFLLKSDLLVSKSDMAL